jgi:hypothetical protein
MYLILDTETTGVAPTARIVSISWAVYDESAAELVLAHHIIIPEGFTIPVEASAIHGISGCVAGGLAGVWLGTGAIPEGWTEALAKNPPLGVLLERFVCASGQKGGESHAIPFPGDCIGAAKRGASV